MLQKLANSYYFNADFENAYKMVYWTICIDLSLNTIIAMHNL
jgi:hypothetical protein